MKLEEYEQYLIKKGQFLKIVRVNTGRFYIFRIPQKADPRGIIT